MSTLRERARRFESGELRWVQAGADMTWQAGESCIAFDCADDGGSAFEALTMDQGEALVEIIEGDIEDWNDAPGRTLAEVVEALRKAADLLGEPA